MHRVSLTPLLLTPALLLSSLAAGAGCSEPDAALPEKQERGEPTAGKADGSPAPAGWNCYADYYDAADGCDCGCGIVDPDCEDDTVDACAYTWCGEDEPLGEQNWLCPGDAEGAGYRADVAVRVGDAQGTSAQTLDTVDAVAALPEGAAVFAATVQAPEIALPPGDPVPGHRGRSVLGRVDADGTFAWGHTLAASSNSGTSTLSIEDVSADADGVLFVGSMHGEWLRLADDPDAGTVATCASLDCGFWGRIDAHGALVSIETVDMLSGPHTPRLQRIEPLPGGGMVVAGSVYGTIAIGDDRLQSAEFHDVVVAVFDAAGSPSWARRWGGLGDDLLADLAVLPSGDLMIAATTGRRNVCLGCDWGPSDGMSFGGEVLGDGDKVRDVVIARIDERTGAHAWSRALTFAEDDPGQPTSSAVRIAADAHQVVLGVGGHRMPVEVEGETVEAAAFLRAFDLRGQERWTQPFFSDTFLYTDDLALRGDQLLVAGSNHGAFSYAGYERPQTQGSEAFVGVLSAADGLPLGWSVLEAAGQPFGGRRSRAISLDQAGRIWWGGWFSGELDVGQGPLRAGLGSPGYDGFVVGLVPSAP